MSPGIVKTRRGVSGIRCETITDLGGIEWRLVLLKTMALSQEAFSILLQTIKGLLICDAFPVLMSEYSSNISG